MTNNYLQVKPRSGDYPTLTDIRHGRETDRVSETPPRVPLSRYFDDTGEEEVTRVYLALLREPDPNRDKLVARGLDGEAVDRAVGVLHWRGLVDASVPDRWTVAAPDIAMRAYASAIERQARRARAEADEMAAIYQRTRETAQEIAEEPVRTLATLADLDGAMSQVLGRARRRVVVMRALPADPQSLVPLINLRRTITRQAEEQGLETVGLYDSRVLDVPGALDALQTRRADGESIRLSPVLPFSAVVADTQEVVLDFRNIEPNGGRSLLIRSDVASRAVEALVRRLLADSVPLPVPGRTTPEHSGLSERDLVILALLASGATDATIARQLEVSQRTVERRVSHLMSQLGVATRFQAGVEASKRGLL